MSDQAESKPINKPSNKWLLPIILSLMTLFTSGLLMLSNHLTADKIAAIKLANKLASLQRLIPNELIDNDLLADAQMIYEPIKLGHRQEETLYLGKTNGRLTFMAIPVIARDGYSGDIELLVGVKVGGDDGGQITTVEIIAHKETPGLGDLIEPEKSDWIQQFPSKSLGSPPENQWKVKKDQGTFHQITAATITPRAVVSAIKQALLYHRQYLDDEVSES
ncbi:electron transport complex subunit RsxG [Marinicella sp. S1101]|uniref:electron transport complex subunit RsxG n=1 Tax=Marinicella marina TaxID=2996016 RepID=UPI002260BD0F|nr:electron transport complex subunit RsxG [Marinicella marina]MCX7552659.1 electron transport complex subunit RsxG [Marinicella marina]MDJ1139535.1 electron transport complex subunit RsxG [Marinicella marina]